MSRPPCAGDFLVSTLPRWMALVPSVTATALGLAGGDGLRFVGLFFALPLRAERAPQESDKRGALSRRQQQLVARPETFFTELRAVAALLRGADPLLHARLLRGETLLHAAVSHQYYQPIRPALLDLLLGECPALVAQADRDGRLPLHLACSLGDAVTVRRLLAVMPETALEVDGINCQLPLGWALGCAQGCSLELADMLLEAAPEVTVMRQVVYAPNDQPVRLYHPLHLAVKADVELAVFERVLACAQRQRTMAASAGNRAFHDRAIKCLLSDCIRFRTAAPLMQRCIDLCPAPAGLDLREAIMCGIEPAMLLRLIAAFPETALHNGPPPLEGMDLGQLYPITDPELGINLFSCALEDPDYHEAALALLRLDPSLANFHARPPDGTPQHLLHCCNLDVLARCAHVSAALLDAHLSMVDLDLLKSVHSPAHIASLGCRLQAMRFMPSRCGGPDSDQGLEAEQAGDGGKAGTGPPGKSMSGDMKEQECEPSPDHLRARIDRLLCSLPVDVDVDVDETPKLAP